MLYGYLFVHTYICTYTYTYTTYIYIYILCHKQKRRIISSIFGDIHMFYLHFYQTLLFIGLVFKCVDNRFVDEGIVVHDG